MHIVAAVAVLGEVWVLVVRNVAATVIPDVPLARSAYELMGTPVSAGGIR